MEQSNEYLLTIIPHGKANAITRAELASRLGVSDRSMRKMIEAARRRGLMVSNDGDGAGYYVSDDLNDIERQYRLDTARAMAILSRRKEARKKLKEAGRKV